jgi:hypothetical protein
VVRALGHALGQAPAVGQSGERIGQRGRLISLVRQRIGPACSTVSGRG